MSRWIWNCAAFRRRAAGCSRLVCAGTLIAGQAWAVNIPAQSEGFVIRSWQTEAGLPQNTVNAITQTRDGYLWLATRDGLARFDGVRFKVFGLRDGLPSVEVQALYEDRAGTLWIGTSGGGLSRWVDGRIESIAAPDGVPAGDAVTSFVEDDQGRLWIGRAAGLSIWQAGRFVKIEALAELEKSGIRTFLRDRQGGIWIATLSQGLFEFRENRLEPRPGPDAAKVQAYCLLEDDQGGLWASVGNGAVLCRRAGSWSQYDQQDGLPFAFVTSLVQGADGTVWAGSLDDGLYRFSGRTFEPLRKEDGLSANDIRCLRFDREGNLWVGTRTGGLNRLTRRKVLVCGPAQGLTNDYTRSVAESADGTLWVGTTGGGLYRGDAEGFKSFATYHSFVESVLITRDGSLWWGASRGVFSWKEGRYTGTFTNETWIRSAMATALCEDMNGGVWVGTSEGKLQHFQDGEFTTFPKSIARGAITALAQESAGDLWVGSTAGGLKRVRLGSENVFSVTNGLLSESIRTLHLDGAGGLWIGTAGGGLSRWRAGRVGNFTARQGLAADTVVQIVEDDEGCLWLGTSRGIFAVRKQDLEDLAAGTISFVHPRVLRASDGLPSEECSSGFCPAGFKTRSGWICFSTVKGLVFVDPRRQQTNSPAPNVLLEEVVVNGRIEARPGPSAAVPGSDGNPPLRLPPGGRALELHFTATSFGAPEKVRFRYRMQGADRDWIEAGERRAANYHLSAGNFLFEVVACNADGVWSEPGDGLAIEVQPYLWERTWVRAGAGLAIPGLLWGVVRLVERKRYRRRLALVETRHAVERERLRISQDMHDHIGGLLTRVSILSDVGESESAPEGTARGQFERIGRQVRSAVQALDEIVWATNPKNDNLRRFADYVGRFADEFFEGSPVRCWQELPADLPNLPLRADVRHNVFLAVKEAFNNVLKHSAATEIWLRLTLEEATVRLWIEDNGLGFRMDQLAGGGNGLDNMRTRLAEGGGTAEFTCAPGQGTKIRFSFPLAEGG